MAEEGSSNTLSKLSRRVGKAVSNVGSATASVASLVASSASDMLSDRRNAFKVLEGLQTGLGKGTTLLRRGLQSGAETITRGGKQMSTVLRALQRELVRRRTAQQLNDECNARVDVQIGFQVYEDEPQETRSRLWIALLENPSLATPFNVLCVPSAGGSMPSESPLAADAAAIARHNSATSAATQLTTLTQYSEPCSTAAASSASNHDADPTAMTDQPSAAAAVCSNTSADPSTNEPIAAHGCSSHSNHGDCGDNGGITADERSMQSMAARNAQYVTTKCTSIETPLPVHEHHAVDHTACCGEHGAQRVPSVPQVVPTQPCDSPVGSLSDQSLPAQHAQHDAVQTAPQSRMAVGANVHENVQCGTDTRGMGQLAAANQADVVCAITASHSTQSTAQSAQSHHTVDEGSRARSSRQPTPQNAADRNISHAEPSYHAVYGGTGIAMSSTAELDVAGNASVDSSAVSLNSAAADLDPSGGLQKEATQACSAERRVQQQPSHTQHAGDNEVTAEAMADDVSNPSTPCTPHAVVGDLGEWHVVPQLDELSMRVQAQADAQHSMARRHSSNHIPSHHVAGRVCANAPSTPELRQALYDLKAAMYSVPWPLPDVWLPTSRYGTLLQLTVGQEDVDEVIHRDISRTFPGHPQFGMRAGQQALYNVLKAYSMHDLEVGYCQGMAFVAGVLLMYVPQEPAFRLFCRLMAEDGANLRRLYLPGLTALKVELAKFDWLLERHLPRLFRHLRAHGVPSVLYASQWFLTAFSCPFPPSFTARVIDVMLFECSDAIVMQTALAMLADCEWELLTLDDFEDIISFIKVDSLNWPQHRMRRILDAALSTPADAVQLQLAASLVTQERALAQLASCQIGRQPHQPPNPLYTTSAHTTDGKPHEVGMQSLDTNTPRTTSGTIAAAHAHDDRTSVGGTMAAGGAVGPDDGVEGFMADSVFVERDAGEQGGAPADVEQELWKQMAEMDEEYLTMMREIDNLWDAGDGTEKRH